VRNPASLGKRKIPLNVHPRNISRPNNRYIQHKTLRLHYRHINGTPSASPSSLAKSNLKRKNSGE
jgi:hypothetical protein